MLEIGPNLAQALVAFAVMAAVVAVFIVLKP